MGFIIKANKREIFGKNASRRLRMEGMIPAVIYGAREVTVSLNLKKQEIFKILRAETGENTIFQISFDSEMRDAMIKEIQRDPVTDEILHADFIQITMDKTVRISVPVLTVGEAVGVKTEGGFIDLMTREVELECFPKDIPENIKVDISDLHLHQSLKVEDIAPIEGVEILSPPDAIVVLVEAPSKEEEIEVEEKEEEIITEGEEPEIIKREKAGEEEKKGEEKEEKKGEKEKE
jgi:large subunit ribosomal protein L25